jgi:dGTPase
MEWHRCFSTTRYGELQRTTDDRSAYERDYDRIVFSSAFRRLQNKTQVFPLPERVFVHNRLTHSLEVVSVGRSLGMIVGTAMAQDPALKAHPKAQDFYLNQLKTVVSAACLAHDLGNPAFGHSGEEAISKYFIDRSQDRSFINRFNPREWSDLIQFEGNANALRILTRQYPGRQAGGYQVTLTTLASILKYPCESVGRDKTKGKHRSKFGYFQGDQAAFEKVVNEFGLPIDSNDPQAYYRHPFVYLVEAADDICYSIIDYEDAHRLGILSFAEVRDDFLNLIAADGHSDMDRIGRNLHQLREDKNESVAYLRAKAISVLVRRCSEVFLEHRDELIAGAFKGALIDHLTDLKQALKIIEKKSIGRIYNHESVVKIELAGFKIMSGLIEDFVEAALLPQEQRQSRHRKILGLLPGQFQFEETESDYQKVMSILDHVSGMTDNYALELYRNLRGISVPGI